MVKMVVNMGAISFAHSFNILDGNRSGPEALLREVRGRRLSTIALHLHPLDRRMYYRYGSIIVMLIFLLVGESSSWSVLRMELRLDTVCFVFVLPMLIAIP